MSQHIGIVACSAEGAAPCYRTISHSLAAYVDCFERGDCEVMLASAEKLARIGADFPVSRDISVH